MSGILWAAMLYIAAHLTLYEFLLRHHRDFRAESAIFLYHALSFVLILLASVSLLAVSEAKATAGSGAVAAVSLHGIYSLSFLAPWSLWQGSYSLGILRRLHANNSLRTIVAATLKNTGNDKIRDRLESLQLINLIAPQKHERWKCTRKEYVIEVCLNLLEPVSQPFQNGHQACQL